MNGLDYLKNIETALKQSCITSHELGVLIDIFIQPPDSIEESEQIQQDVTVNDIPVTKTSAEEVT